MPILSTKGKIRVRGLTKRFGDLTVLNRLSFDIMEGEFLGLVGPTGCGKTTFCNVVSRIQPPTAGIISMDGQEIDPRRHNVAFVFQEPSCLPWRTVEQDVALGLEIKNYPSATIRDKVQAMLDLTGLTPYRNFYPHQLSAGTKQRVGIARAFVTEPDLLLMDEPFGQLDTATRFFIENQLIDIWRATGRTVIFVTHSLEEAVYLSQRILVLTQKPTEIKEEVLVDLDYPRNIADPGFIHLREKLTDLVKWW